MKLKKRCATTKRARIARENNERVARRLWQRWRTNERADATARARLSNETSLISNCSHRLTLTALLSLRARIRSYSREENISRSLERARRREKYSRHKAERIRIEPITSGRIRHWHPWQVFAIRLRSQTFNQNFSRKFRETLYTVFR